MKKIMNKIIIQLLTKKNLNQIAKDLRLQLHIKTNLIQLVIHKEFLVQKLNFNLVLKKILEGIVQEQQYWSKKI